MTESKKLNPNWKKRISEIGKRPFELEEMLKLGFIKPDTDKDKKLVFGHQWEKLLSRVFEIDISKCKYCGGELKIISAILNSIAIQKILTHLGLSARPPPIAPARIREIFATIS